MKPVTMYTRPLCGFCSRAKKLLKTKKVPFKEIDASRNAAAREQMIQRSGGARTYPQIFIGDHHVGGCDELMALERSGKLDALLTDD